MLVSALPSLQDVKTLFRYHWTLKRLNDVRCPMNLRDNFILKCLSDRADIIRWCQLFSCSDDYMK